MLRLDGEKLPPLAIRHIDRWTIREKDRFDSLTFIFLPTDRQDLGGYYMAMCLLLSTSFLSLLYFLQKSHPLFPNKSPHIISIFLIVISASIIWLLKMTTMVLWGWWERKGGETGGEKTKSRQLSPVENSQLRPLEIGWDQLRNPADPGCPSCTILVKVSFHLQTLCFKHDE